MANETPSRATQKKQAHSARIGPSMLDELEAMVRYSKFQRSLSLWQNILKKDYVGVTEEEEIERDAPRTKFRIAAIMEADRQWVSRSIQDIRNGGETAWAFDAVKKPLRDPTNVVRISIPTDLSLDAIQQYVGDFVRQERKTSGVKPIQNPRAPVVPGVDLWKVYDMMQQKDASLATVRDSLCGPYGCVDRRFARKIRLSPQDKRNVKRDLKRVTNAYRHAKAMIQRLDSPLE